MSSARRCSPFSSRDTVEPICQAFEKRHERRKDKAESDEKAEFVLNQ